MKKTILITGAEGVVGSYLRVALAATYDVRMTTLEPVPEANTIVTDITNMDCLRSAFQGVESVIHLAASTDGSTPWDAILHNNIIGTYSVFEAARQAGVQQIIFASSNHAIAIHEREFVPLIYLSGKPLIDHLVPLRPDSLYGVSKCFGEVLGRFYADYYGMRVICLRIGSITAKDVPRPGPGYAERETALWQSKRDFAQLVEKCLAAEHVTFDIFYGVSNNHACYLDLEHARAVVGYVPQDSAEDGIHYQHSTSEH